jgi:hypothetical protein
MNQKIAGSSPVRINRVLCGKDLDRLVWQADRLQQMSPPSSPTHRYKVKIYRNLKGTKYSSQVHKKNTASADKTVIEFN